MSLRQLRIFSGLEPNSTAISARLEKRKRGYRTLPSLKQYVIVEQNTPLIEVYSRLPDNEWNFKEAIKLTQNHPAEIHQLQALARLRV